MQMELERQWTGEDHEKMIFSPLRLKFGSSVLKKPGHELGELRKQKNQYG